MQARKATAFLTASSASGLITNRGLSAHLKGLTKATELTGMTLALAGLASLSIFSALQAQG